MTEESLLTNGQKKKLRKFLFLFVTAADEAEFMYDGASDVSADLKRQWAIEIERAKVDLLIQRMRDRSSFSYWLQWLYPLACVIAAALDPEHTIDYILTGFGGTSLTNISRKISKHAYLSKTSRPITAKATEIIPEPMDASNDEPDGGPNLEKTT